MHIKDAETIEKMRIASRIAATAMVEAVEGDRARRHDRRARRRRPRVHARPRRLPVPPRLQGLPEVGVHERQRGHLPRHPRRPSARGRRHRQHRRHGLHRRRARRHRRDLPRRRRRRGVAPARRAHPRGDDARHPRGPSRAARSTSSAASSRATPSASATASCATSPATASALEFHSGLIVPHYDAAPHYDTVIEPGMTFTIEPMLNLGTHEWEMWDDRWTVVTADRRRSAQFEHTILITDDGNEILTLPEAPSTRPGAPPRHGPPSPPAAPDTRPRPRQGSMDHGQARQAPRHRHRRQRHQGRARRPQGG